MKWVFNSTAKPENVMGNYAFLKDHPTYMSSEKTRQYMVDNCQACRDDMVKEIGGRELIGSEIVIPSYTFKTSAPLHPKILDWKTVPFSCVKQTGDTLLWNDNAKILYGSGAIYNYSIPSLAKSHTQPWARSLEFLRELNPEHVIGSGTISSFYDFKRQALDFNIKYLNSIYRLAEKNFISGVFADGSTFQKNWLIY